MKNSFYALILLLLIAPIACKKTDDNSKCPTTSALSIAQNGTSLTIQFSSGTGGATPSSFEVSFQPGRDRGVPSGGNTTTVTGSPSTKDVVSLGLSQGEEYTVYARAICADGLGEWGSPVNITIANFCSKPTNLMMSAYPTGAGLSWESKTGSTQGPFEVQYGSKGFTLGSGTIETVNASPYLNASMTANTTYDFYVRGYCSSVSGWGDWAGPFTYFATKDQNTCATPSNLSYTVQRNGQGKAVAAAVSWKLNGQNNFEYTFVYADQPITTGTIQTVSGTNTIALFVNQNTSYDFYIRTVCNGGITTAWTHPLRFNIGQ